MKVTIQHLYSVPTWTTRQGYCGRQSRAFFAAHGFDWSDFLQNGIEADLLRATGNALAIHLVEWVEQQAQQEVASGV